MDHSNNFDTDVLIVGNGPTGATLALALATYGVKCHMVARFNWLADTPRAHITNQRTMEVLRDLGVDKEVCVVGVAKGVDRDAGRERFFMPGKPPFRLDEAVTADGGAELHIAVS